MQNVEIVEWRSAVERNHDHPLALAREGGLVGGVMVMFTNRQEDPFATRVPIRGELGALQGEPRPAIAAIVRNAFVETLRPSFEAG